MGQALRRWPRVTSNVGRQATIDKGANALNALSRKALEGVGRLQIVLALLLFLPAWTVFYWEAWLFWFVFGAAVLIITLHFLRHNPELIQRRLDVGPRAEQRSTQKLLQAMTRALVCALVIAPGIDRRFHWSQVPVAVVLVAQVAFVVSMSIVFFVFKENSYTLATIAVEPQQQVVSTGPYAVVRHPMYFAAVLGFTATPLALGSVWALVIAVPNRGSAPGRRGTGSCAGSARLRSLSATGSLPPNPRSLVDGRIDARLFVAADHRAGLRPSLWPLNSNVSLKLEQKRNEYSESL